MKILTENEALNRAAAYCSGAEHCCKEVMDRLKRWGMEEETAERIVARLIKERFIDEERFARAFIHDKYAFEKWGKRKIANALRMKEIPEKCYAKYIGEIPREEYMEGLKSILEAKSRTVKAKNNYERNGKLIRFAAGKGYDIDDIMECLGTDGTNGE